MSTIQETLISACQSPLGPQDHALLKEHLKTLMTTLRGHDALAMCGSTRMRKSKARKRDLQEILGNAAFSNREDLADQIGLVQGFLTPHHIRNMPVETLTEIFLYTIAAVQEESPCPRSTHRGTERPAHACIGRVCRKWRAIILSQPRIRNTFVLTMPPRCRDADDWNALAEQRQAYWQAFEDRVQDVPQDTLLRVSIQAVFDTSYTKGRSACNELLTQLFKLLPRTSHLALTLDAGGYCRRKPEMLARAPKDLQLPFLEYLDCRGADNVWSIIDAHTLLRNPVCLQALRCSTFRAIIQPLHSLVTCSIEEEIRVEFLIRLLMNSPLLLHLDCGRVTFSLNNIPDVFHNLKYLRIGSNKSDTTLRHATLPHLTDMHYGEDDAGYWPTEEHLHFFKRSENPLHHLSLKTTYLLPNALRVVVWQAMKSLCIFSTSGEITAAHHAIVDYIRTGHHPFLKVVSFTGAEIIGPRKKGRKWEWRIEANEEGKLEVAQDEQLLVEHTGVSREEVDDLLRMFV